MKFKEGAEILLSLSVASDEMMRAVHMFPEVGYMNVTSSTNRGGRGLHLLVVKDASGETYIRCASILPCQQRWAFKNMHAFLWILFGDTTMSRMRLMLIDDDLTEYGPFDACTKIDECYKFALHMLCVFHGLVIKFQEKVYTLLPCKRTNSKELSTVGNLCGECSCHVSSRCACVSISIAFLSHLILRVKVISYSSGSWLSTKTARQRLSITAQKSSCLNF